MSSIGRTGNNESNFTITLDDIQNTFNISDIVCNDSVTLLLNEIAQELFNTTFDNILNINEIIIASDCINQTISPSTTATPTSINNFSSTNPIIIPSTTENGFFTTKICLNETTLYDVFVNVADFLILFIDILTLRNNPTLNISDITVDTIVDILNDSLIDEILIDAFNLSDSSQNNTFWIDTLYEFDYINPNLTIGEIYNDFIEAELIFKLIRLWSSTSFNFNITLINNIIESIFGNNTNLTLSTPSPTIFNPDTDPNNPFNNITDYDNIFIYEDGSWNPRFIEILINLLERTGVSDSIDLLLSLVSIPEQPSCLNSSTNNTFQDIFMFFNNENEMEEYTQYRDYGDGKSAISAGIVFKLITNESINYVLRFNQTDVHDTTSPYIDKYGRSPLVLMFNSFYDYIDSGFLGWQNAIDQTFLRILNYNAAIDLKIGIHVFPFPPYEDDPFWTFVKRLLPMMMVIAFSYPFVIIAKTIVDEKAARLKEGYRILGGSNTAYLLSYIISYFILFSISSAFLTWCLCANVYIKSDPLLMYIGIELFGLCMISLAMIIGMLFDQPRLGALVACLVFLCVFYVYRFVENAPYENTKNAICWSGPAAFAMALLQINEYEEYQIGSQWSNIAELNELTHFRLSTSYYYMLIDFIIYTIIMFYLDRVWPTKYGVRRPWYSPFEIMDTYIYDKCKLCRKYRKRTGTGTLNTMHTTDHILLNKTVEYVDENITGKPLLELKNLTKIFRGTRGDGRDNIAVNKLNLSMYKSQVFCLLGHNGAGKTTTVNMITGLLSVTSGDAYMDNNSLVEQLQLIRSQTGLCPQHDILFPRMTVWEHLQFYGQVNGLSSGDSLDNLCMDLINKIYLNEKINAQSRMLSGGQKRKLSVCIALIGNNNLIILDEPTTGMDPFARRATWSLIREYKKDKCIILTTHFMDEAEILADRIAIMVHGKLVCCGSSFYLKSQYDVGYALKIQLKSINNINKYLNDINEIINEYIKTNSDSNTNSNKIIGQAATEILWRISFESNQYLPLLFRYFDKNLNQLNISKYSISATTLEEVFRTINAANIFSTDEKENETSEYDKYGQYKPVKLKNDDDDSLNKSKQSIQTDTADLSINSDTNNDNDNDNDGGTSITTLKHTKKPDTMDVADYITGLTSTNNDESMSIDGEDTKEEEEIEPAPHRQSSFLDGYDAMNQDETFREFYSQNYVNIGNRSRIPCFNCYFWRHVMLQIWKRMLNAKRDAKTFWCQCAIPSFFIIWGLATTEYVWWEDQPLYYFNTVDWIESPQNNEYLTVPYNEYNNISSARMSYFQNSDFLDLLFFDENNSYNLYQPYLTTPYQTNLSLPEWQDILYNTRFDDDNSRYISLYFSQFIDPNILICGANASGFHSVPTVLNLASSFISQIISGNHSSPEFITNSFIRTGSHPFPRTASQDVLLEAFNGFFTALILAIGLIFVPAAYIALLVDERVKMVKHQQLVSGMDIISYWCGNFLFDVISNIFPATLCLIYVWFFNISLFLGEAAFVTWFVIVMYGWSVVPFTYLASLFFSSPGTSQALTIFIYYSAAVIAMCAAWIMDIIEDDDLNSTNQTLKIIYRFFPPFCLSDSFRGLVTRDIKFLWGYERNVYDWEVTGRNLFIMFVEGCGYFSLLLLLEYMSKSTIFLSFITKINQIEHKTDDGDKEELDSDVLREQNELKNDINNRISSKTLRAIEIHGLRKVYRGSYSVPPTIAVDDLWYSVSRGEIFGFLGMNGAGKTTTLSIISGVFPSSSGCAYINNFPITDQISVRQSLGFCPQFSALFPRLTVGEHLEFFAKIKGINNKNIRKKLCNQLIKDLSLKRYKNCISGQLSGGNQRKLSVGIALIGNPPIVLMDEPTSGMDPVSKRSLWDFISSTMNGRSVILTTHSMEECEALCNKIGIMINGQLSCLGSNQYLKSKFGKGYQLDIEYKLEPVQKEEKYNINNNPDDIELKPIKNNNNNNISLTNDELNKIFDIKNVILIENYTNHSKYQINNEKNMSIADIFEHIESIKIKCNISNYAISQTSLEQIFLRFAKKQKNNNDKKNIVDKRSFCQKIISAAAGGFVIG